MARRQYILLLAVSVLTACSAESPTVPVVVPARAFNASFVPAAVGEGNFQICLTYDISQSGIETLTLPPNILFSSWGPLTANLRTRVSYDPGAVLDHRELTSYALVTTSPLTLTVDRPCVVTSVRMVKSPSFDWTHDVLPTALHYVFSPVPMMLKGKRVTNEAWGDSAKGTFPGRGGVVGDAIAGEYFNGVALRDVGDPILVYESD